MSYLGDIFAFEKENLSDIWRKVKKDPERLFLGAADPWSSKLWGKITGKDYEPLVDQMGGAYGGHTISAFGNDDGGVYGRARQKGINTGPGGNVHDIAHVISAMYAGNYGLGKLGGGSGSAQNNQWQQFSPPSQEQDMQQPEQQLRFAKPIQSLPPEMMQMPITAQQQALAFALRGRT